MILSTRFLFKAASTMSHEDDLVDGGYVVIGEHFLARDT